MFLVNNFFSFLIYPLLIIFILQSFSFYIYKKFFSKENFFFINLLTSLILITLISNITQIILIFDEKFFSNNKDSIKFSLIFFLFITPLIFFYNKKKIQIFSFIKKNFKLNHFEKKINLYLVIIFLSSIGVVSDADSLIYNSKISKIILNGFSISYFIDNIHLSLAGIVEIFNVYQEILGVSNLNRILNIFFIINFLFFVSLFLKNFKNKNLFILSIISIPIFSIILNHEKTFFMPLIVQFSIFIYLLIKKEISNYEKFLIVAAIISSSLFKLSFLISGLVLFLYIFYKYFEQNKNFYFFIVVFSCLFIFGFPHLAFKFYYFGNPFNPFLNDLFTSIYDKNINFNFLIYLKNWITGGSLSYPINLFVPGTFSKIHNILGFGIIIILFIKNIRSKINSEIFLIFFVTLILTVIFSQNSPRFYIFPLMILMCLLLKNKFKYEGFLKIFFVCQFIFTTTIMSLMIPVTITTSWLGKYSENYRNKFIYRYQINKEIEKIIGINKFIIIDTPNYYSKNFDISLMTIFLANSENNLNNYKDLLNSTKIEYLITTNFKIENVKHLNIKEKKIKNFLEKCFYKPAIKTLNLDVANRKKFFINQNKKNNFYIYKIKENCIF